MKSLNPSSLSLQNKGNVSIIDNIILYEQFSGLITEIVSGTSVKVKGDATSLLSNTDTILCPLKDFSTEDTITSISYSAGYTTIEFDGELAFTSDDLDKTICLKIDISDKLTEYGISDIDIELEFNVFQFDSGKMSISVDNSDSYFLDNDNSTGIFDSGDVFWCKYTILLAGTGDVKVNFFAGLVDLTKLFPDIYNNTLGFNVFGHTYELKRYPAYTVSDLDSTDVSEIGGINVVGFTGNDDSEEGVKVVEYKPFTGSRMEGVVVESVSYDTEPGIRLLEYMYPFFFRWDNGDWTKVGVLDDTDNDISGSGRTGKKKVYAKGGSGDSLYAVIIFGDESGLNEYPDSDSEIWVNIKDENTNIGRRNVGDQGEPALIFDGGEPEPLRIYLQRVLINDGSFTEITYITNVPSEVDATEIEILASDTDYILLMSPHRFWGVELVFSDEVFSASDLDFYFSVGGESFSAAMNLLNNGLDDGTDGAQQDGRVIWTEAYGWAVNEFVTNPNPYLPESSYKGYMIKIVRNSATGVCKISEAKKLIRARGINADFLEFTFQQALLSKKDKTGHIVLTKDGDGNWNNSSFYENISIKQLLDNTLDVANYPSSNRTLSDLVTERDDYTFNIWGKPPKFNYSLLPSAMCIDFSANYIYVALGLEIWRCSYTGTWEKITTLNVWGTTDWAFKIHDMFKIGDELYCTIYYDSAEYSYNSILFYKYNISTDILTYIDGRNNIIIGSHCIRQGKKYALTTIPHNVLRSIGQSVPAEVGAPKDFGENLCIPFQQEITTQNRDEVWTPRPTPGIDLGSGTTDLPVWYFSDTFRDPLINDNSGPIYNIEFGYYRVTNSDLDLLTVDPMWLKFTYGQQGCKIKDKTNGNLLVFQINSDSKSNEFYGLYDFLNSTLLNPRYYDASQLPICHHYDVANGVMYFGFTSWYDEDTASESFSYFTKYKLSGNVVDWDKVFIYHSVGTYVDVTSDVNSEIATSNLIDWTGEGLYLGSTEKFRNAYLEMSRTAAGVAYDIEYWDGSAWVAVKGGSNESIIEDMLSFTIPRDWTKVSVNGSASLYWVRLIVSTWDAGAAIGITKANLSETVIWDSELDNSGNYPRYMPLWLEMDTEKDVMHGCMFNRDDSGTNAIQWVYFVYDLNNNTCYFQNAGDNFTYDGTFVHKDFSYDSYNNCVYSIAENRRYKDKSAYLIKSEYDVSTHAITLTRVDIPVDNEWGSMFKMISNPANGNLYGVSKGYQHKLWEYAKEFYIRIELAKFPESDSIKDILKHIAQVTNCHYMIHSEREMRFLKRDVYNGSMELEWGLNLVKSNPVFPFWEEYYDAVKVAFKNLFVSGENGNRKLGFTGWLGKIFWLQGNPLIQNRHVAKVIVYDNFEFFNDYKYRPENVKTTFLFQLEILDKLNIDIPSNVVQLDKDIDYLIVGINMNSEKNITLKLLEMKGASTSVGNYGSNYGSDYGIGF